MPLSSPGGRWTAEVTETRPSRQCKGYWHYIGAGQRLTLCVRASTVDRLNLILAWQVGLRVLAAVPGPGRV